ncbi:hypothetical protein D3C75_984830 [compost metagenome]
MSLQRHPQPGTGRVVTYRIGQQIAEDTAHLLAVKSVAHLGIGNTHLQLQLLFLYFGEMIQNSCAHTLAQVLYLSVQHIIGMIQLRHLKQRVQQGVYPFGFGVDGQQIALLLVIIFDHPFMQCLSVTV